MAYYRSISDVGPESFLFYVVARVGPAGAHRPVAVALRDDRKMHHNGFSGVLVVEACLQAAKLLSSPANRVAIESELALATAFYASSDGAVARSYLPRPSAAATSELGLLGLADDEQESDDGGFVGGGVPEFPFISTTLLLGLSYDVSRSKTYDSHLQPLETAFRDDFRHHEMVVIDISDLDRVQCGIVAFTLHHMAMVNVPPDREYDLVEDDPPDRGPDPFLEKNRLRTPLSASDYMKKFFYRDHENKGRRVKELELRSWVVDSSAMDFIWPRDDGSIRSLVESTWQIDNHEISIFDGALEIPGFRGSLRRRVLESQDGLGPTLVSGLLLQLLYEKQDDLNWVQFKNISYEAVAAAVESPELRRARSLRLCVERLIGDPEVLLKTLCRLETGFQSLCFLQEPTRANDDASASIYMLISTRPEYLNLLLYKDVTLTAAYSAPLRNRPWLPTMGHSPPFEASPVHQIFIRHTISNSGRDLRHGCFDLRGDLLGPERFAAGFLAYLRSFSSDAPLLSFSCAPSLDQDYSDIKISPILAGIPPSTATEPCGLNQGSWIVLVSRERRDEADLVPLVPLLLRYAFIRARRDVAARHGGGGPGTAFGPGDLDVCDLAGFLRATAPNADAEIAMRQLDLVAKERQRATAMQLMYTKYTNTPLPETSPGMRWISAFDEKSACSILMEFLDY